MVNLTYGEVVVMVLVLYNETLGYQVRQGNLVLLGCRGITIRLSPVIPDTLLHGFNPRSICINFCPIYCYISIDLSCCNRHLALLLVDQS